MTSFMKPLPHARLAGSPDPAGAEPRAPDPPRARESRETRETPLTVISVFADIRHPRGGRFCHVALHGQGAEPRREPGAMTEQWNTGGARLPQAAAATCPFAAGMHALVTAFDPPLDVGDVAEVVASDRQIFGAVAYPIVVDVRGSDVEVVNGDGHPPTANRSKRPPTGAGEEVGQGESSAQDEVELEMRAEAIDEKRVGACEQGGPPAVAADRKDHGRLRRRGGLSGGSLGSRHTLARAPIERWAAMDTPPAGSRSILS